MVLHKNNAVWLDSKISIKSDHSLKLEKKEFYDKIPVFKILITKVKIQHQ